MSHLLPCAQFKREDQEDLGMGLQRMACIARYSVTIFAAGLTAAGAYANELKCEGPFARNAGHEQLVSAFGEANVAKEIVHEEGMEIKASVVFPDDPEKRLEVIWWDEEASRQPSIVRTLGTGWSLPKGVRVGMPLNEVEAANGRPFLLYGFGWDYGGTISDWKGGALARLPGDCNPFAIFSPEQSSGEDARLKVSGDSEFGSDTLK
ncbi:hypothetical protein ACFOYU_15100 [Microvirga sp. GCM10011540]|uniref:hypothetical protein n=1 Tax=Microvirga sp. GCM10011540 TaxID=3317338 RepID=UPI00361FFAC4